MKRIGLIEVGLFGSSLLLIGLGIWFLSLTIFGSSVNSQAQIAQMMSATLAAPQAAASMSKDLGSVTPGESYQEPAQASKGLTSASVSDSQATIHSAAAIAPPSEPKERMPSSAYDTVPEGFREPAKPSVSRPGADEWPASLAPPRAEDIALPRSASPQEDAANVSDQEAAPRVAPSNALPQAAQVPVSAHHQEGQEPPAPPMASAAGMVGSASSADSAKAAPVLGVVGQKSTPSVFEEAKSKDNRDAAGAHALASGASEKAIYEPSTKRDPMMTPEESRLVVQKKKQIEEAERLAHEKELAQKKASDPFEMAKRKIKIQGVLHTDAGMSVIINNQIFEQGDSYAGSKIVQISERRVVFKFDGRSFTKEIPRE